MSGKNDAGLCSSYPVAGIAGPAELLERALRAEACCAEIRAQLDQSQRIAHLGSWEWELETNRLFWSKETYNIFGLQPSSSDAGREDNYASFISALHPEDRFMVRKAVVDALQHRTLYSLDYRILRLDNRHERILHVHAETVRDPVSGSPLKMIGTIQDVTARRQAFEKMELLQSAVDHASESIVITDHRANIIYVNPAFTAITGYSQNEVVGVNPRILQSGQTRSEVYAEMWQTLISRKNWRGHFLNQRKDGSLYEEEVSISPLFDHEQKITHYVAVKRDVSEEALLRRRLQAAQRMEAIGTLASGIAHDFNNILTILVGNLELAMMFELEDDHPAQKGLHKALAAGQRAKELVAQILTFSRRQTDDLLPLKTNPIIKEAVKLISVSTPASIKVELHMLARQDIVLAAPGPIHQIIMNLCSNAVAAMGHQGGRLQIKVENLELNDSAARCQHGLKAGNYLVLNVSDTGHGIEQAIADKIFEPYFTTRSAGQGSGLGLATVHGLVRKLSGDIYMTSAVGQGSTFTVLLPTLDYHETIAEALSDLHKLPTGSEHLLLVDDEKDIVEINQKALEKLGYRVTACYDGAAALKMVQYNPKQFDLVLTDMTMPQMTGDRLVRALLELNPEIAIILGTGYADSFDRSQALALGVKEFYHKPLSTDRLVRLVRKVLNDKRPPA
ncbi:MAG: PAS domain S-box protein [Deltaproteobacteria bacterium]|nr:PAS domain S-box protein [Deltaproteobacteria bacterium]